MAFGNESPMAKKMAARKLFDEVEEAMGAAQEIIYGPAVGHVGKIPAARGLNPSLNPFQNFRFKLAVSFSMSFFIFTFFFLSFRLTFKTMPFVVRAKRKREF